MAKRPQKADMAELGSSGLKMSNGVVNEEFMRQLKGNKKYKVYTEMKDNDPVIGAILFAVEMLIRQSEWSVVPSDENDEEAIQYAAFVESCMHDMSSSWESTISEIISFLPYGFSAHEIVYKKRSGQSNDKSRHSKYSDGKIGWRKIPGRAQDTIVQWLREENEITGLVQRDPHKYTNVKIPIEYLLLFRTTANKGNPEGKSILRNAYRPWYFKKRIEEIEGIGLERDLAGLPIARVPAKIMSSTATAAEKAIYATIKEIVTNIRRDEQEGVVFPGDTDEKGNKIYDIELLSSGGQRQFDTDKIVNRYDKRIAMVILADFILLGHDKVGSHALSSDKTSLFAVAIGAWLDEIKSVFNRHAIPRLLAVNGMNLEKMPEIQYSDIEDINLDDLGNFLKNAAASGMELFPDDELENAIRGKANLPQKKAEDM